MILAIGITATIVIFYYVTLRNNLVYDREQVERAWSNIDVVLKQRFDEIPQLVQVVEQYVKYEQGVIQKLSDSRQKYGSAQTMGEKISSASEVSVALKGVFALSEGYPELKSSSNFIQLQSSIEHLEETIADRRETYNDVVTTYNTRINQFPDAMIASSMNFERKPLFHVDAAETVLPHLKMNIGA